MKKNHHCCCKGAFPTEISLAKADTAAGPGSDPLDLDRVVTRRKARDLFRKFKKSLKIGDGSITLKIKDEIKGSFTVNQEEDTVIELPDGGDNIATLTEYEIRAIMAD